MKTHISAHDKINFIKYFLNNYHLKKRECVWILNYLMNDYKFAERVHFVEDAKFCDRSLVMSTHCVNEPPLRFYKKEYMNTDPEKAFHDIRMNRDMEIFVELKFKDRYQDVKYLGILEENPNIPDNVMDTEIIDMAKKFLDQSIKNFEEKRLLKRIDTALDNRDEESFVKLTNQFKEEFGCRLSM